MEKSDYSSMSPYVGSLVEMGASFSMGCLMEDGHVLTTLHSIFDFETQEYRALELMRIFFVKNDTVYGYSIKRVVNDGIAALKKYGTSTITYDYALLALEGAPLKDLGGGLEYDTTNYWELSGDGKPRFTLAVSAPILTGNITAGLKSTRYVSRSENSAAKSGQYMFQQSGEHHSGKGFSGQAIFPYKKCYLYAVHVGYDIGSTQTGFEVSDYVNTQESLHSNSTSFNAGVSLPKGAQQLLLNIHQTREILVKGEIKDIRKFLADIATLVTSSDEKFSVSIPKSLESSVDIFHVGHQKQHLQEGARSGKTLINPKIATTINSPVFIALGNAVNKLVSHYYRKHRKELVTMYCQHKKITNQALQQTLRDHTTRYNFYKDLIKSINFIVDLNCGVGLKDRNTKNLPSCFMVDGFTGNFHLIPMDGGNPALIRKNLNVLIDAHVLLEEAYPNAPKTHQANPWAWAPS